MLPTLAYHLQKMAGAGLRPALTYLGRRRLPQVEGQKSLAGLEGEVLIHRDEWGIPRIQAASRHDLFFAQGFVHAQDRFWQMELNRRAAAGTLAALVGDVALETDRLSRTLGFSRLANDTWENSADHVRADVAAYAAGVNARLRHARKLPLEFTLLRSEPEPWTPLDTVAFARLMAWTLSHGLAGKLTRAQLVERLGPDLAAALEPIFPERNPVTLPEGIEFNALRIDDMMEAAAGPYLGRSMEGAGRGSNGWVLSGQRSATGHPILCNDVHLPVRTPSLWYYNHLRDVEGRDEGKGLHVAGVSLPGLPYVLVGHNAHIAWGATLSFVDCEDLFIEQLDMAETVRYQYRGSWYEAETIDERIEVRGKQDHIERVIKTRHGPIISNIMPHDGRALALNSMALREARSFDGFARLNAAESWDDFRDAIVRIESPTLNLIYADTKGNIGYHLCGKVPLRANGQGLVPVPGWTGEHEWTGEVPFEQLPYAFNPKRGFVVTANHRIVGDDYPYYLGSLWRNGYRARRLEELIMETGTVSVEACCQFHLDTESIPGKELADALATLETSDPDATLSLKLLCSWDGRLDPQSAGGAVYEVFLNRLSHLLLEPHLGAELTRQFLGKGPHANLYPVSEFHGQWVTVLLRMLADPDSRWLPAGHYRHAALIRCLSETARELRRLLGGDIGQWQWGRLQRIRFDHAMSSKPILDEVFGQGPVSVGGDSDTVYQTATSSDRREGNIASSYRQVVDLGNLDASRAMLVPGQSGNLGSKHYGNLIQPWLDGEYFAMTRSKSTVARFAAYTLTLTPDDVARPAPSERNARPERSS
jgi:penicillin amidase